MYEAESHRSKGWSVRVVQELSKGKKSKLVEPLKQNTAAMVNFLQQQQQLHKGFSFPALFQEP